MPMLELLTRPWPWYVAGPLIGLVVPFVYWYGGKKWGVSSSLQHLCAAVLPAGMAYFRYEWRRQGGWRLALGGGKLAIGLLGGPAVSSAEHVIDLAPETRADLAAWGVTDFSGMLPSDFFSFASLLSPVGVLLIVGGGFLVGFGARYANGCTSGHAISGLATLQMSSLAAVL